MNKLLKHLVGIYAPDTVKVGLAEWEKLQEEKRRLTSIQRGIVDTLLKNKHSGNGRCMLPLERTNHEG